MKGNSYRTPEGQIIKVIDFDPINKMAYIHVYAGNYKWVHDTTYNEWIIVDDSFPIYVPDIPAQMIDETKPKTTKKKKDAASS
jgi:hypothetical protein